MFKRCTESSESLVVVSIQGISERIPGTLRFTPNSGIVLSITDVNPDILNTFSLQPIEYEIIHGQFVEGAAFTLINSFVKDTSIGSSNIAVITIVSNGMLNGVHINNLDEPTFEGIDVQLSSLNNWFNIKTIELDITDIHSPTDGKCFSLTCKHAQRIGFSPLEKGPSILSEQYISSNGYGQSSHGELNSIFSILLHPREYFSINSLDHELFRLQGFMSLLCGHQVFINQVKLFTANITDKKEKYLKVSHHLACYSRSLTDEDEKLEKILLTRDVLDDNLPVAWSRWTERYHLYRTPIQLFMATEIFQNQLLDFKFLSIMQALEALHRNIKGGKYLKESEYEKVADILRNAIPLGTQSDLHQSLQSRIRYGNEYSLRRRIKELWNKLPNVIQNELHPKFLSCYGKIIDTRNFFTHYDIDLEPKAYKGLCGGPRMVDSGFAGIICSGPTERNPVMSRIRYSQKFKHEAVRLVIEENYTLNAAAKAVGVSHTAMTSWVHRYRDEVPQRTAFACKDDEIAELRKENARLRRHCDILKKATAFFAREETP